jgi:hypothetical protein
MNKLLLSELRFPMLTALSTILKQMIKFITEVGASYNSLITLGIGMSLTPYENFQVYPVLRGNEFTYSRLENPGGSKILSAGRNVILGATVQVTFVNFFKAKGKKQC